MILDHVSKESNIKEDSMIQGKNKVNIKIKKLTLEILKIFVVDFTML